MSIEAGESGTLPGRLEFVREPSYFEVPTDPNWKRYSDRIQNFAAGPGMQYARQPTIGTADAVDHDRGQEDPAASIEYHLQQPLVDQNGDPVDAATDGVLRDENNQLLNSHLICYRREQDGGNFGAGIREYTVVRGGKVASVEFDNDPTAELPIPVSLDYNPRKVRSYLVHQPDAETTLDIVSTSDQDTMDLTIEDEGAATTETISVSGTTTVTTTESFGDVDAVFLSEEPVGDVTITDGSDTTVATLNGGESHSDDGQPVDGDRGIPALGEGSHADPINTEFEHFVGDRLERPAGSPVRARVSAATLSVENDFDSEAVHTSRLPVYDESERTVTMDADVAGKTVSHRNFEQHVLKDQQGLEHELDNTLIGLNNTVPVDVDDREVDAEEGVTVYSVTFEASGEPAIELSQP